jgi:hypothetical protein
MMRKIALLAMMLVSMTSPLFAADAPAVKVWPRLDRVNIPTGLRQFMFFEIPAPPTGRAAKLTVTLPEKMVIEQLIKGAAPALPAADRSVKPAGWKQQGNVAVFEFAPDAFPKNRAAAYLSLAVAVDAAPGEYTLCFRLEADGMTPVETSLPLIVHPPLRGEQPKQVAVITYDYPGLAPEFIDPFLHMMKSAGINTIHRMRAEEPGKTGVLDRAAAFGIQCGLIFFVHQIQQHFDKNPLPDDAKIDHRSLAALLDRPEVFKAMMREFFRERLTEPYVSVTYDAERGAFSGGKAVGDLSAYSLAKFRTFAGLPEDTVLDAAVITARHRSEWTAYNCQLTVEFAKLFREYLNENHPQLSFEIYSGYQFDTGPNQNRTRELYSVDWAKLADVGFDSAIAGYFGSRTDIQNTAAALRGRAALIPAEMYVENFNREKFVERPFDKWSIRLLQSYLAGSRRGLGLWYANVMDGNALLAIDRITTLIARTEETLVNGVEDDKSIIVQPRTDAGAVTVLRHGGYVLAVAVNPDDRPKTIRLNLAGFNLKGYTGELAVTDVMTGKKIAPAKVLEIEIAPRDFRALQIFEDGN